MKGTIWASIVVAVFVAFIIFLWPINKPPTPEREIATVFEGEELPAGVYRIPVSAEEVSGTLQTYCLKVNNVSGFSISTPTDLYRGIDTGCCIVGIENNLNLHLGREGILVNVTDIRDVANVHLQTTDGEKSLENCIVDNPDDINISVNCEEEKIKIKATCEDGFQELSSEDFF